MIRPCAGMTTFTLLAVLLVPAAVRAESDPRGNHPPTPQRRRLRLQD